MEYTSAAQAPGGLAEPSLHDLHEHDHKSSLAFRTISEVSEEIDVPQHVLRFWESKFAQIRPLKRGGGRRYYRPEDIELLRRVKNYLYKQGYTIKGVQRLLKEKRETATTGFVPYANPAASLPGYSTNMPAPGLPAAPLAASYLHAAAAAPSAMAMAYGSIGSQIGDQLQNSKEHFGDAFEQVTLKVEEEAITAADQMEQSLAVVTRMHEEIAASVLPIRITNPAAPRLEDMEAEQASAPQSAPAVLEFDFESAPAVVAGEPVLMQATQVDILVESYDTEDVEFNQDVESDDLPVKRLDAEEDAVVDIYAPPPFEAALDDVAMSEMTVPVNVSFDEQAAKPMPSQEADCQAVMPDEKRQELKALLAEMMALRDMLQAAAV